jgi:hypothetical protein
VRSANSRQFACVVLRILAQMLLAYNVAWDFPPDYLRVNHPDSRIIQGRLGDGHCFTVPFQLIECLAQPDRLRYSFGKKSEHLMGWIDLRFDALPLALQSSVMSWSAADSETASEKECSLHSVRYCPKVLRGFLDLLDWAVQNDLPSSVGGKFHKKFNMAKGQFQSLLAMFDQSRPLVRRMDYVSPEVWLRLMKDNEGTSSISSLYGQDIVSFAMENDLPPIWYKFTDDVDARAAVLFAARKLKDSIRFKILTGGCSDVFLVKVLCGAEGKYGT